MCIVCVESTVAAISAATVAGQQLKARGVFSRMGGWWNWQTRKLQNLVLRREGSMPSSPTNSELA